MTTALEIQLQSITLSLWNREGVDTTDLIDARGQVTLRVRVRRLEPALNVVKGQWYHINSLELKSPEDHPKHRNL